MRSGSTFVGEIFNNHPNAFYQFEPLHEFYQFGCDAKTDLKYESLLVQGSSDNGPLSMVLAHKFDTVRLTQYAVSIVY